VTGIKKKISVHTLRHSFATYLLVERFLNNITIILVVAGFSLRLEALARGRQRNLKVAATHYFW